MSSTLITPDQIREAGDISSTRDEGMIVRLIDRVLAQSQRSCHRIWLQATHTDESHDAVEGQRSFWVDNPPLISISSLTHSEPTSPQSINWTNDVRSEDLYYSNGEVHLYNTEGYYYAGPGSIKITYVGGYTAATFPEDLHEVLVQEVLFRLNHPGTWGIKREQADGASVEYDRDGVFARQTAEFLDGNYRLWRKEIV